MSNHKGILITTIIFLIATPYFTGVESAANASTIESGSFQLASSTLLGSSTYTILYKYSSTVQWGKNLTVSILVEVNQLTGVYLYLFMYGITATVFTSNGLATTESITAGNDVPGDYVYEGAHWGPFNVSIPISHNALGNATSNQNLTGYISLTFIDTLQLDRSANTPYGTYQQSGSQDIGNFTIVNGPTSFSFRYSYLLLIIPVLVVVLVLLIWYFEKRKSVAVSLPAGTTSNTANLQR
jgi:hypothetical protein